MAPRETPKEKSTLQRTIVKSNATKKPAILSAISTTNSSRRISVRKATQTPLKVNTTITIEPRQFTNTVPPTATPKKDDKSTPMPKSVSKSAKKSWKRRPKPAHSGVPVPEKMKKMMQQQLLESDNSL